MTRAKGPTYRVAFRRRLEKKTNYSKRLALVKSGLPRMVVRKSNRYVLAQFVEFRPEGDRTICTIHGKLLAKRFNWPSKRNSWSAYLVGLYAGKEAAKKGVKEFVLDIGMRTPSNGSILFAALQGAVDAGLTTKYDEKKVPSSKLANPPEAIKAQFNEIKAKILSGEG
jgi:large subunit ribosomal protein L18